MAENKTQPTTMTVTAYLASLQSDKARADAKKLIALFTEVTKAKPVLWGNMVGFGSYHYIYDSGREGDAFVVGFAIRKTHSTIYAIDCKSESAISLKDLGPHTLSGCCLHIRNLDVIDMNILKKIIRAGVIDTRKKYPVTMK